MESALDLFSAQFASLGYRSDAVIHNYRFSDLRDAGSNTSRVVSMAVFTQTPASYRTAAFGIAESKGKVADQVVRENTALGAPIFFVLGDNEITQWKVESGGRSPKLLGRVQGLQIEGLFSGNPAQWGPDSIHRAKSIGRYEKSFQLEFVDIGLLPAIEGQIHRNLDRLLSEALAEANVGPDTQHARLMFQGLFRLLSAKVLFDRNHSATIGWNAEEVDTLLSEIGTFYSLQGTTPFPNNFGNLEGVWRILRNGMSVANISADDLAYVYENTLVTPKTRKDFGTHSTPRHVADYIVSRLGLWNYGENLPKVYEPFCGAGVFLVAALRQMRDFLPHAWSDLDRHKLLVQKISGDELDAFACEVATLSLILADYPNTNGWRIQTQDLFKGSRLSEQLSQADVVLCNPPFEAFNAEQKIAYSSQGQLKGTKAELALSLALKAQPSALGFVLPQAFLQDRAYKDQRDTIEREYSEVELVSLPDGVFAVSQVESALLIAKGRRAKDGKQTLRRVVVVDGDRGKFAATGEPSSIIEVSRDKGNAARGGLWIHSSQNVWDELNQNTKLGSIVEAHWGVRWKDRFQSSAISDVECNDSRKGVAHTKYLKQYRLPHPLFLDVSPQKLYAGGKLPWDRPKVLMNAARKARGPWKFAAAVDRTGLWASQQFVGIWERQGANVDLDLVAAILNSPLGNAFLSEHNSDRRIRISSLLDLPMPRRVPSALKLLIREYGLKVSIRNELGSPQFDVSEMLDEIDHLLFEAYDLSPRHVRTILASFGDEHRPTTHDWEPLGVSADDPALSIRQIRSPLYAYAKRGEILKSFSLVSSAQLDELFQELE